MQMPLLRIYEGDRSMSVKPDPALRDRCRRFLSGHGRRSTKQWLETVAASPHLALATDEYNAGPAITLLEDRLATLLGKPAALFFPKGVMAQQAALLVHAERTGRRIVALHPKSHIALDEEDTMDRLAGLLSRRIGSDHAPFGMAELEGVHEPLAAVTVELPLRRAGFIGTPWKDLQAVSDWCRRHGVPFHLDGARLWEVQPWLGRGLADIAGLADTIYVSFYKGLSGMGGAVLAGEREVIEAAKVWRSRYGGNFYTLFPFVLTALDGLDRHLPRMGEYHEHALRIAAALAEVPGVRVHPSIPHCNSFQIHLPVQPDQMIAAGNERAGETGEWLYGRAVATAVPGTSMVELVVGDATTGWTAAEVREATADLLARARNMPANPR